MVNKLKELTDKIISSDMIQIRFARCYNQ